MAVKEVRDLSYSTGYGVAPTVPNPTGIGKPWLPGPILEPEDYIVLDTTPTTPAAVGKLLVPVFASTNPQWAYWIQNTVAGISLSTGYYGIVNQAVDTASAILPVGTSLYPTVQQEARITWRGPVKAFVAAPSEAVTYGTPLSADASGNLVPAVATTTTIGSATSGTATPFGTTGSTTITYSIYTRGGNGLDSAALAGVTTGTGNAALSATNGVTLAATIPAGTQQVVIVRTAGGAAQGVVAILALTPGATSFSWNDIGAVAGAASYTANAIPQVNAFGGAILAVAMGTLAAGSAATLTQVFMGGY